MNTIKLSNTGHGETKAVELPVGTRVIDLTPTWRGVFRIYLELYATTKSATARVEAFNELARMADLADLYVASTKEKTNTI